MSRAGLQVQHKIVPVNDFVAGLDAQARQDFVGPAALYFEDLGLTVIDKALGKWDEASVS